MKCLGSQKGLRVEKGIFIFFISSCDGYGYMGGLCLHHKWVSNQADKLT